jgi:hypothetical protein
VAVHELPEHRLLERLVGVARVFFLPTTTIAYAIAQNEFTTVTGGIEAMGIVLIVLGIVIDLGLLGGSGRGVARRG